jgi:hypothetical protein
MSRQNAGAGAIQLAVWSFALTKARRAGMGIAFKNDSHFVDA